MECDWTPVWLSLPADGQSHFRRDFHAQTNRARRAREETVASATSDRRLCCLRRYRRSAGEKAKGRVHRDSILREPFQIDTPDCGTAKRPNFHSECLASPHQVRLGRASTVSYPYLRPFLENGRVVRFLAKSYPGGGSYRIPDDHRIEFLGSPGLGRRGKISNLPDGIGRRCLGSQAKQEEARIAKSA